MSPAPPPRPASPRRVAAAILAAVLSLLVLHHVLSAVLSLFLFHPSRDESLLAPGAAERVTYTTTDGVRLSSWLVRARGPRRRTVVYFHGNAGLAAGSVPWGRWLAERGADVLLAEYRGYGASEGSPSAAGVERDAEAAIRFLLDERGVAPTELVVHGQSLGGAAAIAALAGPARDAAGGVIESSFPSLHDMARVIVGVPLTYLVPDAYHLNSAARAASVRAPLLQLHGDRDEVIPFALGQRLCEALRPRRFVTIEGGSHNLASPRIPDEVQRFLEEVTP